MRRREKSNGCTLDFASATLEFMAEKNCLTEEVYFGDNVFKNPARYVMYIKS